MSGRSGGMPAWGTRVLLVVAGLAVMALGQVILASLLGPLTLTLTFGVGMALMLTAGADVDSLGLPWHRRRRRE